MNSLLFTSFLITLVTCKTEVGLNLNCTVAGWIWAVADCSLSGCILLASLLPMETK